MSPSEKYNLPVIGQIKTSFLNQINYLDVILEQEKYYICNVWHKTNVPQLVPKDFVIKFTPLGK